MKATLTKMLLEKLVEHLLDLDSTTIVEVDGDLFLNIGCSYGSLIWGQNHSAVTLLQNLRIRIGVQ
jgi:hypothetical protein